MKHVLRTGYVLALIVALFVPIAPIPAASDCPESLRHVQQSTSFREQRHERISIHGKNGIRTTWGDGDQVSALNRPYRKMEFEHPWEPFVPVGKESVGEKNPELVFLLDDICHFQLDLPRFEEEFLETFRKKPLAQDYVSFYESRFLIFEDGLSRWLFELKKTSPESARRIEPSYQRRAKELRSKIGEFNADRSLDQVKNGVEGFQSNVFGMMGELYVISGIPRIKSASTALSEMPEVMAALEQKLSFVREKASRDPEYLATLEKEFPNVFSSNGIQNQIKDAEAVSVEKKLEFIQKWIKQKEIDVVRSADGVDTWLEVKTKRSPMTVEEFTKDRKGFKSPERQIQEDLEILRFLELDSRIKLEFLVTAGMTDEVWQMLKRMNVHPIDLKGGPVHGKVQKSAPKKHRSGKKGR